MPTQNPSFEYIASQTQLEDFAGRIKHSPWLTVDTEFVREKTYYPVFCLLQVSNGAHTACLDPFTLGSMTPLRPVFQDRATLKVFHSARQDLEILHHFWQELPSPLFDTQIAAALTGMSEQISYAGLIEELLGITIDKSHTRTDWSRRPLSPTQLEYAALDVQHLGPAYLKLIARLNEQCRLDWAMEDSDSLLDHSLYTYQPHTAWKRVSGSPALQPTHLARLKVLAAWRESKAQTMNLPRNWVLHDESLCELASMPDLPPQSSHPSPIIAKFLGKYGREMYHLFAQAATAEDDSASIPPRLTPEQKATLNRLIQAVRLIADVLNIKPAALAGRRDLEAYMANPAATRLTHGWRKSLLEAPLARALQG